MTFRDLSYWAIVKLILFITMAIPVIAIILLLPFVLFDVFPVTYNLVSENPPQLFGIISFEMTGAPRWVAALIVITINIFATSKVLQLLAKYTPLGRIKIETTTQKTRAQSLSSWRQIS